MTSNYPSLAGCYCYQGSVLNGTRVRLNWSRHITIAADQYEELLTCLDGKIVMTDTKSGIRDDSRFEYWVKNCMGDLRYAPLIMAILIKEGFATPISATELLVFESRTEPHLTAQGILESLSEIPEIPMVSAHKRSHSWVRMLASAMCIALLSACWAATPLVTSQELIVRPIHDRKNAFTYTIRSSARHIKPAIQLSMQDWHCGENMSADLTFVEGNVKNISKAKLKGLIIEAIFTNKNGDLITCAQNLIFSEALFPDQIGQFKVITVHHPQIEKVEIRFKLASGKAVACSGQRLLEF